MSDSLPAAVRALIGVTRTRRHLVTEHEVRRFAQAIGEPVPEAPPGQSLVAPPLFCQALAYEDVPLEALPADGSPRELDVPLPAHRTVGGSSEYTLHRAVRSGETVTITSRLKDVYPKQGKTGLLFMVVVETTFTGADGQPIASELATFIKRA